MRPSTIYIYTLVQTQERSHKPETTPETGTHLTLRYETNLDQRYNKSNNKIKQILTIRNSHQSIRVFT